MLHVTMSSTTVRISDRDRLKLEVFAKALGEKSLGSTFSELLRFVENRKDEFLASMRKGEKIDPMVALLYEARGEYGKTSAKKVDEYLYGVEHERVSRQRRTLRRIQQK